MIIGIGTDVIEIERIEKACQKEAFLRRIFTAEECRQARGSFSKLAGNFAVKEAVSKCLGTGFRTFMPQDIEVLRDALGKPYVNLFGGAKLLGRTMGIERFHVTISNTKEYVVAFVIGEGEEDEVYGDRQTDENN